MDYSVLEKSSLFSGVPAIELREALEGTPHHIQCYDTESGCASGCAKSVN